MNRACSALLIAGLVLLAAMRALPAGAQDQATQPAPASDWAVHPGLLAAGAGAITGVLAFNILSAPLGTVPLAGATLEAVPYNIALGSRLIATATAGAGALAATYIYDTWTGYQSDYAYLMTVGAGALAGVAAGNLLTGMIGTPPYYVGAGIAEGTGAMASSAAQAASRVYVIASGVFGAWAADWWYRRQ